MVLVVLVGLVGLVCWWCVAWGIAPCGLVCGCWCVGVHVCVCCLGADAPMVVLVVLGGVGVGSLLPEGAPPCVVGVLVCWWCVS